MRGSKLLGTAALGLLFTVAAPAAELQGYLMDKMCAKKFASGDASAHDRSCLMSCAKNGGYGILTSDGKYVPFDKEGNRQAQAALKNSDKKSDIKVDVSGEEEGGVFKVKSLKLA